MATTKATNLGHRSDVTLKGTTTTIETDVVVSDTTTINNAGDDVGLKINSTSTGHIMQLQDNGTDVMVVEDGGNVGIGTDSPSEELEIQSATPAIKLSDTDESGSYGTLSMAQSAMYLQANGASSDGTLIYRTGNAGTFTERLRIDSSGSVGINRFETTQGVSSGDHGFFYNNVSGYLVLGNNGEVTCILNRWTTQGNIIQFRYNGSNVGSISTINSRMQIGQSGAQLFFDAGGSKAIWPADASGGSDNTIDLGDPSFRFDDIYATNGTIQTSDRNEKQDIEELSEAEQRVAVACKALMRKYRWKDAVAEKGNDARIHFGIIAQDLQDAFTAEGLDAGRYAMFISSTWWETSETYTDDEGIEQTRINTYDTAEEAPEGATERTRLGVRYPELLAFIIAAI